MGSQALDPGTLDDPPTGRPRAGRHGVVSTRVAWVGLCAVVVAVATFAAGSAVVVRDAAAEAKGSADIRQVSVAAQEALTPLEDIVDAVVQDPSPRTRGAYDDAESDAAAALRALREAHDPGEAASFEQVLADLTEYTTQVERMFVVAETDPDGALLFEEDRVDPSYEALLAFVSEDADLHWRETSDALEVLTRTQEMLLTATLVVVGLAVVPLVVFARALRSHRREIDAQALANRHQALHDPLTGLPNRTLLRLRAETALVAAARDGETVAILLIDLDRFKEINDTLGHHYGDVVLKALATRLKGSVRTDDTVARLGGDEFAVVLHSVADVATALRVAMKVRAGIEQTIESDGMRLTVEASVGVVLSGVHGDDVETLMQHADIAMYVAKDRGVGACVYDSDLNGHSLQRLGLLGELRNAIDQGELVVHYQPKVSLLTRDVSGVEALVRWLHPEQGLIPPDAFIPLAEQTGLIRPLTHYVIDAALAQCRAWQDSGRDHQVAVNISARNLLDEGFCAGVAELLGKWRLAPGSLQLEVTESAIMTDPPRAQATLAALSALGVTLAIDDFGAGYTSLAHLKSLPVHVLKIDQSFVREIAADGRDASIVRSIVELAHNLGLQTVAEGVEDAGTLEQLAALGCDMAQGYHLGRPVPAEALDGWFEATRAAATGPATAR